LLSGIEIPLQALRAQVAGAVDIVIHTARFKDGSRRIVSVAEVLPLSGGEYAVRELMCWRTQSIDADGKISGAFETVAEPTFLQAARIEGFDLSK
jgi:pilus assembly protein CpaF